MKKKIQLTQHTKTDAHSAARNRASSCKQTIACEFKYCPVTSVDVERSFSAYKLILTDKRQKFNPEHLEKLMVVYCKANYNQD